MRVSAKTDARDAYVIAEVVRTMPHTLRRVDAGEEVLAELGVLIGFDDDQAAEATRIQQPHPRAAHPDPPRRRAGAGPQGAHHRGGGAAGPLRRAGRAPRRRPPSAAHRGPLTDELRSRASEGSTVRRGTYTEDMDRAGYYVAIIEFAHMRAPWRTPTVRRPANLRQGWLNYVTRHRGSKPQGVEHL